MANASRRGLKRTATADDTKASEVDSSRQEKKSRQQRKTQKEIEQEYLTDLEAALRMSNEKVGDLKGYNYNLEIDLRKSRIDLEEKEKQLIENDETVKLQDKILSQLKKRDDALMAHFIEYCTKVDLQLRDVLDNKKLSLDVQVEPVEQVVHATEQQQHRGEETKVLLKDEIFAKLNTTVAEIRDELTSQKQAIRYTNKERKKLEDAAGVAEGEHEKQNATISSLEGMITEKDATIEENRKERKAYLSESIEERRDKSKIIIERNAKMKEVDLLKGKVDEKTREADTLQGKLNAMEREKNQTSSDALSREAALNAKVQFVKDVAEKYSKEKDEVQKRFTIIRDHFKKSEECRSREFTEKSKMNGELKELRKKVERLMDEGSMIVDSKDEEINALTNELTLEKAEVIAKGEKIKALKDSLLQARKGRLQAEDNARLLKSHLEEEKARLPPLLEYEPKGTKLHNQAYRAQRLRIIEWEKRKCEVSEAKRQMEEEVARAEVFRSQLRPRVIEALAQGKSIKCICEKGPYYRYECFACFPDP